MRISKLRELFCVVAMFMATVMLVPTMAKAEGQREPVGDAGIFYTTEFNIKDYWNADSSKSKAPIIENCVFGGWYKKDSNTYKALTADEAASAETAYAKFVPAYVLSVKAQNMYGTTESTENTSVRIITSVDSKQYKAIGFEVYLANKNQLFKNDSDDPLETTRVYDGIMVQTGEENSQAKNANAIFGEASKYVSVWELTDINKAHYSKIIYVRPYWITKDGTKVEGLAKYVHIEDDYNNYISVPVNLLNKDVAAQVAAGAVNVTYGNTTLTLKEVEAGRMLPEMNATQSGNSIKMVGNAITPGQYNSNETLYANIRFKKPSVDVDFEMEIGQFCTWGEDDVADMDKTEKWDVKYDAQ